MKLAFSTLGCPDWDLNTIITKALEYGFDGIEIRGILDELDVTTLTEFTTHLQDTKQRFFDAGLEIACFSSSVFMGNFNKTNEGEFLQEIENYAKLAEIFRTPFIRIFGGETGDRDWDQAIHDAMNTLEKINSVIVNYPVKIVIETHDDWMSGNHFRRLMESANYDQIGILWDVNHPYMFIGEKPATTWQEAGKWIYHTHWKDSKINKDSKHGFEPCLMGEGVLPLQEIYDTLKNGGYNGYLSLEWEKRWHPEIPGPEIAFPLYANFMRSLMKKN